MSFIVAYNGQFSPYILPDFSSKGKVREALKLDASRLITEHEDDDFELTLAQEETIKKTFNKNKSAINHYKKTQKSKEEFHIPHLARDLMSHPVHYMHKNDSIEKVMQGMEKFNYRHFPIVNDEDQIVGIVSDRDILRNLELARQTSIENIMTPKVLSAREFTRIQDIAKIMLYERINCLPIINEHHQLLGLITQTNILEYVIKTFPIDVHS
jgi:predicted transcriptional regulator